MAAGDRKNADSALIAALAAGRTVEDAARRAHVSPSTVARRQRDPEFVARVDASRRAMWETAISQAAAASTEAVSTLRDLLSGESPSARLGAARALLETTLKGLELLEL